MSVQTDFHITIDRAAGLLLDAAVAARSAARGPIPASQRRALDGAIVALDQARDCLFVARNDPWPPPRPKPIQLSL